MPRLPVKLQDRQQWLLDFPKQFYAEKRDEVFLLNIDSDALSESELINFSDNGAIVATGAAIHTGDELLSVDFPIDAEQYASHGINRSTQGVGLIKSLELGLTLDPTLGPNNGAFPACQAKLHDGTIAKGRGIMIPYGRGLAALDGGTSGSIITWESFVKRYQAHPPSADYLYRGQPDNTMDLIPKYFRQTPDDVIKTRFTPHIKDVLDANTASPALPSIRRMAEMQHLGRPTMLLDWTESPLIAAYFAFAPTPKTETKYVRVFEVSAKLYRQESPEIFGKKLLTFFAATTLENQKANERAIAQKSHFSFNKIRHISAKLPDPSPLKKCWDISIQERSIALAFLDQKCGISARSLGLED